MNIGIAFRAFFAALFNGEKARQIAAAMAGETTPQLEQKQAPPGPKRTAPPTRSEAITLLAALQREARFVDFLQESLDGFSDAQVGAAARDVHRDCGQVIERMFAIAPLLDQEEGSPVEVTAGFDAGRFRLTGNVSGEAPHAGALSHHGWQTTKCELPTWSGSPEATHVIAPAEVEVK